MPPLIDLAVLNNLKGAANGVAELGADGIVPDVQLPHTSMKAYFNGTNQSATSGVITTVLFDTVLYDNKMGYSTSTHAYTVPEDGIYHITASVWVDSGVYTASGVAHIRFVTNWNGGITSSDYDVNQILDAWNSVANFTTWKGFLGGSATQKLTAGDTIHIIFYHNAADAVTLHNTAMEGPMYMQHFAVERIA